MPSSRVVLLLALLPCAAAWSAPLGTRPARSAAVGLARRSAPVLANEEFTRRAACRNQGGAGLGWLALRRLP
eukprot:scaffold59081_cov34-Phaeocystis_antarctica.AAC.2